MTTVKRVKDDVMIHRAGLNYRTCNYMMESGSFCGAMVVSYVPMPDPIPDMPVCRKHAEEYEGWTAEDSIVVAADIIESLTGDRT